MSNQALSPDEYENLLTDDRKVIIARLRKTILDHLPPGFEETISYGMIGYVVPKSIYPAGYHCKTDEPLPFLSIASQKNFIAMYHMGMYANEKLLQWFQDEYPKHAKSKLDMGKSCVRFKKMDDIPFSLIAKLAQKITVEDWIKCYESMLKKS
ncbi:DUF1801 domain-containing protein [Aquirufa aurantiipilula]|uniref:DUF1801 domain-containing protein n=1 Tax=Aquirufa aurantiipilula TaxID=2696561 RepID=A0ABT6BLS1_9BACT|nr:DUF1801 domain-containing protein [Aquirufa aurantiipilula]MBZ1325829.1 DUF1801 domain-containing protein [Aquirufa aurantiipilula]MDF5691426.1 DUF1801 domain-containing protein [Aquirufa aurantiipilula]